jgi:hypothetical protein
MRAELKWLHSPDADDLRSFVPPDPERFMLLVQAMVGPEEDDASESFDIIVCSGSWMREQVEQGPLIGLYHIIMAKFDYDALVRLVGDFCRRCEGRTWQDVAAKVSRLGRWEFDDYREQ